MCKIAKLKKDTQSNMMKRYTEPCMSRPCSATSHASKSSTASAFPRLGERGAIKKYHVSLRLYMRIKWLRAIYYYTFANNYGRSRQKELNRLDLRNDVDVSVVLHFLEFHLLYAQQDSFSLMPVGRVLGLKLMSRTLRFPPVHKRLLQIGLHFVAFFST